MLSKFIALPAALFIIAMPAAAENTSVAHDVSKFDIGGVMLGMSLAEATAAIKETYGVTDDQIRTRQSYRENVVTGDKALDGLSVETDAFEMDLSLTPKVPHDPEHPVLVSQIRLEIAGTPENVASMRERAFEKYGAPTKGSVDDPAHFRAEWCTLPADNPTASCSWSVGGKLTLEPGELHMFDSQYSDAVVEFTNSQKTVTPKF